MKLHYFDIHGRAEPIRLLLKHAQIPFEDIRFQQADWPPLKESGKFEFKQVPVLELENGTRLSQSISILRYLGRSYGYYPQDDEMAYLVDSIIEDIHDCFIPLGPIAIEKDEAKKAILVNEWMQKLKEHFQIYENRLKMNKMSKDFIVGNKWTIADFYFMGFAFSILRQPAFMERINIALEKTPFFAKYLDTRIASLGQHVAGYPNRPY